MPREKPKHPHYLIEEPRGQSGQRRQPLQDLRNTVVDRARDRRTGQQHRSNDPQRGSPSLLDTSHSENRRAEGYKAGRERQQEKNYSHVPLLREIKSASVAPLLILMEARSKSKHPHYLRSTDIANQPHESVRLDCV